MLKKLRGFTLVEMMVVLVINALLFSGLMSLFVNNINHYNRLISISRLNQQLQATLDLMSDEIRRAGYWANARNDIGTNQNNNPFMVSATNVTVNGSGNCILFSYDQSNNGSLPSISSTYDDERYGFRLVNQTVQTRPPGAVFDCSAANSAWENVTDSNTIQITALTFSPVLTTITTGPGSRGITLRSIDISISGRLVEDTSITKTLTQHVRIRNDKFNP